MRHSCCSLLMPRRSQGYHRGSFKRGGGADTRTIAQVRVESKWTLSDRTDPIRCDTERHSSKSPPPRPTSPLPSLRFREIGELRLSLCDATPPPVSFRCLGQEQDEKLFLQALSLYKRLHFRTIVKKISYPSTCQPSPPKSKLGEEDRNYDGAGDH